MLSLQLCWRIKANLANCLQPNFPTFIHSNFPVPVVWGRHQKPHDYPNNSRTFRNMYWQSYVLIPDMITSFFSYLKETDLVLCCRQLHQQPSTLLQCEYLPVTAPASASAHILGLNSWKGNLWSADAQLHPKLEHTTGCACDQKLFRAFSL